MNLQDSRKNGQNCGSRSKNLQDSSKKGLKCRSRSKILQESRSSVGGTDVIGGASAQARWLPILIRDYLFQDGIAVGFQHLQCLVKLFLLREDVVCVEGGYGKDSDTGVSQ